MQPDWTKQRLGDVARIEIGGTPSRDRPEYWTKAEGHPWLSIADLSCKWIDNTAECITDAGIRHSNVKRIPAGTPVMSFKLSIGRVALVTRDMYSNEAIAAFHLDSERVHRTWLYHVLPRVASSAVTDTAIKGATLNKAKLNDLKISLPSLAEQASIAQVLDTLDIALHRTEQLVAKLDQVKRALLHALLTFGLDENGDVQDASCHPERFKPSPLGPIPQHWTPACLGDLVDPARPIAYGILMPGQGHPGGVPVIKVKDIVGDEVKLDDLLLTSPAIDNEYRRSRVRTRDLLFTIRGTVGRTALVPSQLEHANITQDTARVAISATNPAFVRYYLQMPLVQRFVKVHTLGVAVQGINLRDVRRIPIARPPREEADEIARRLSSIDARLRVERTAIAKTRLLKRGLADDLLSGRVRFVARRHGAHSVRTDDGDVQMGLLL